MSKPPRHGDIVEVAWDDSEHIQLGWETVKAYVKAADHPHAYRTAGYWIEGSKKGRVIVALSLDPFQRQHHPLHGDTQGGGNEGHGARAVERAYSQGVALT